MSRRRRSDPNAERPVHRGRSANRRGNNVFYVAVEGELTEPDYLAYLNKEYGSDCQFVIHCLYKRNGMGPRQTVARALEHDSEVEEGVELWALFDRDEHHDIPQAMRDAEAGGVRVAFSHPSFDLWLLLHFADFGGQQSGSSRKVHQRLRLYPSFETFGSHGDKSIRGRRAQSLTAGHTAAVQRAKRLVDGCHTATCSAENGHAAHCDPLHRDPSSDVWRLLTRLKVV